MSNVECTAASSRSSIQHSTLNIQHSRLSLRIRRVRQRADCRQTKPHAPRAAAAAGGAVEDEQTVRRGMLNVECLTLNAKRPRRGRPFNIQHSTFNILVFLFASSALANELTVDKRTLTLDDSLSITLSLDGTFAAIDTVPLPLQNLVVDGQPSV